LTAVGRVLGDLVREAHLAGGKKQKLPACHLAQGTVTGGALLSLIVRNHVDDLGDFLAAGLLYIVQAEKSVVMKRSRALQTVHWR
jgi:hypothetical protein